MTKIFGEPQTGNCIEIREKISLLGKRKFANSAKSAMAMTEVGMGFRNVPVDQDADIILLRSCLVSITTNGKPKTNNLTLQDIDDSVENLENFEQAIEFLKRENKLGEYGKLTELSKEELEVRRDNLYSNIEFIEKLIEEKGN
ncbi:hypothetical protein [uncultured Clostridium sp.]|uniref:hypothetical protein n=1 Tax=uncultured Clostridium sp. TaxID=59620 RepID=UPI0026286550|nr:hypothetical protein [uncultured Clostridium sp.]